MQNISRFLNGLPVVFASLDKLAQLATPKTGMEFWDLEKECYKLAIQIGDQFVLRALEKAHQDKDFIKEAVEKARRGHPVSLRNKGWRTVKVQLMGGTKVIIKTPYFREDQGQQRGPKRKKRGRGRRGLYPVLEALGIQEGVSPASRGEIALHTIQSGSYVEAVEVLKRRGLEVDGSTLSRLAVVTAKKDISLRDAALEASVQIPIPDEGPLANKRVRISLDGGRVRTRKNKKGRKTKKGGRRFEAPWREPRILAIDVLDDKGKAQRSCLPLYDVLIKDADAIFNLLIGYLRLLGACQASRLIFIADGADWIWNRIHRLETDALIPRDIMVEAIDFYHACEHLHQAVEACPKMSKEKRDRLFKELRHILRHEKKGAEKVMVRLWTIHHHKKMRDLLSYFIDHVGRMNYALLKELNLPIGSGQVESAVRRVINLRFKAPGSFWNVETVEALLHLRAVYKAGRWDEMMARILDQEYHLPVFEISTCNDSVTTRQEVYAAEEFKRAA